MRYTTPNASNSITLQNYKIDGWAAAHMNLPIGNAANSITKKLNKTKLDVSYPVLEKYNNHFKENPKVAHEMFKYFKWPR